MKYYLNNVKVFKALGDPKRAMIVDMLSCGTLCACDILEKFDMSQSTLSHHMKILRESGLVNAQEEGKWTYYSLDAKAIESTKQFFHSITTDTTDCMCKETVSSCEVCSEKITSRSQVKAE